MYTHRFCSKPVIVRDHCTGKASAFRSRTVSLRVVANGESGGGVGGGNSGGAETMKPSGWSGGIEKALFGEDLGARDPKKAELETNFSDRVWFNWDTEHKVKPPDALNKVLGLKSRTCVPLAEAALLDSADAERLRNQVPGWRLETGEAGSCIRSEIRVRSAEAGEEMVRRLEAMSNELGHQINALSLEPNNTVQLQLCTPSLGGLTENDFIVAAKINDMDKSDLTPPKRQRFWA
mmetsp:Transcript_34810/g.82583  ORF Transcript_34810/g.82583 Transcript_34810/m.82583 type:complete len:235 (+) Transcript_34810:102-806(+)